MSKIKTHNLITNSPKFIDMRRNLVFEQKKGEKILFFTQIRIHHNPNPKKLGKNYKMSLLISWMRFETVVLANLPSSNENISIL